MPAPVIHYGQQHCCAEEARAGYGTAGDHWGVAVSSLVRAQGAIHAGEVSTVAIMTAEILRHSEVIGYDVFVVPAMLLEAWVAERRNEPGAAEDAYRRALELAGRIGFADHVSFALVRLGSNALARGDTGQAEELCRRALAMAEVASTSCLAAHARVQLARRAARGGCSDLTAWQCGGSASPASNLSAGAPHTKHQPLGHTGLMAWRLLPACCGNGPGSHRSWGQ
jgi:hypothetical protein